MLNENVSVDIKILEQILRIKLSTFSNSLYNKIENVEAWKAWNSWITKFPRLSCVPRIPHFRTGLLERRSLYFPRGLLPGSGAIARGGGVLPRRILLGRLLPGGGAIFHGGLPGS